jgi:enamine deaminase RidA (YjgF/YER057c/UK114 family)
MDAEQALNKLGLTLPELPSFITGKVGRDYGLEEAYQHPRLVGLDLLAVARQAAGSLNRVQVIKLLGMVNATPDFADHGLVIDGCPDLLVEVLGEDGRHARASVGMGSLPGQITVEIEAIIRVVEDPVGE